jgi:hypothetical protein
VQFSRKIPVIRLLTHNAKITILCRRSAAYYSALDSERCSSRASSQRAQSKLAAHPLPLGLHRRSIAAVPGSRRVDTSCDARRKRRPSARRVAQGRDGPDADHASDLRGSALFPNRESVRSNDKQMPFNALPNRRPTDVRVVDLSALAPRSDGLFVRVAEGSQSQ